MLKSGSLAALALLSVLALPSPASAYRGIEGVDYVLIDPQYIRAGIGLAFTSIADLKDIPSRDGVGVFLRVGTPLVSAILASTRVINGQGGFTLYDDLHFDLVMGGMTSTPLKYGNSEESRFLAGGDFGYEAAGGWRFRRFAVWGGIRLAGVLGLVGGTWQPGSSLVAGTFPLLLRLGYAFTPRHQLIVLGWGSAFGAVKSYGVEVDVPLGGRFHIALRGSTLFGADVSPASYPNNTYTTGTGFTAALFLRVGPEY